LRQILIGGPGVSTLTVAHMYTLHSYLLSGVAVVLAIVHLVGLLLQEREIKREGLAIAQESASSDIASPQVG
jgi:cytochrome b6